MFTCPWVTRRWEATGARRKVTPGAAPRLGAASGGPAVPLSTRARWPRRVWLPGTSYAVLRDRCGADAQVGANRAGVCDMGVQARGLLPARAGRRGSRGGLRAAKRRIDTRKTRPSVSQGKLALFIDLRARRQSRRKKAARDSLAASTACSKKHHSAHAAAARSPTHRREAAPAKQG